VRRYSTAAAPSATSRAVAAREQLLDGPGVLRSSGVGLEQGEIGRRHHRHRHALDRLHRHTIEGSALPSGPADDDVDLDGKLPRRREPHRGSERTVGLAATRSATRDMARI
jgi:hypothetical protein